MIDVNEKAEIVAPFARKRGFKFPVLLDVYGIITKKYDAEKLPRYILINKEGKIALTGKGYSTDFKEKLRENLVRLLDNKF